MSTQTTTETFAEIEIPTNPFPGLRPFEFDESHLFFGRDGQSEQLIGKLSRTHFLAVVGTSGSGKSSLVRAGFLPALYGGFMTSAGSNWRVAIMRPGSDPIGNLARALNAPDVFGSEIADNAALQTALAEATLRRGGRGLIDAVRQAVVPENENLLVVVDQFEEIFRFARVAEGEQYQNEAAGFIKLLLEASRQREIPLYVVLTMRSDYLGDCSQFWELPEAINESQYLIPRLTRDQLREAITGPVAVGGGRITPRLVNRLLNDVGDNQDQLPVLQHLLMRVWNESTDKQLAIEVKAGDPTITRPHKEVHQGDAMDLCCSEAVGGMTEALSRHADEAFNELPDERHRVVAEKLFKALTEKGADNREIRRPIILGEICAVTGASATEAITVIETFRQPGRSFLMPPAGGALNSESLIDISHESLIRGWARLKDWVDEEARSARTYQRLADTAALYRKGEEGLLRDPGLQLALDWHEQSRPNPAWARRYAPDFEAAMTFLEESGAARDAEARQKQAQRRREIKRARITASVFAVLFLLALGALFFAFTKAAEARAALSEVRRQSDEATTQKNIALRESTKANLSAIEATKAEKVALDEKQNAEDRKKEAEKASKLAEEQTKIAVAEKSKSEAARIHAETEREKATESEKRFRQLNYVANMNLAQKAFAEGDPLRVKELLDTFLPLPDSPKSDDLREFDWYYLRRHTYRELATLKGHEQPVVSVTFSPDGKTVAAGSFGVVKLWDVSTHEELATLAGHKDYVDSVSFSPDGQMLASSSGSTVKLWNVSTRKELPTLSGHTGSVLSVAFSPDGKMLATGSEDSTVKLWDVNTRRELATLSGHTGSVLSVAFSPDGKTLASGSLEVQLWDVNTRQELTLFKGHDSKVKSVTFSPDGKMLAAGSDDATVTLWDVKTKGELTTLRGHTGPVNAVSFAPDGKTLVTGSEDDTAKLWDISTLKELFTLKGHTNPVNSVAFSPDGKTLATGSGDWTVELWDLSIRQELATLVTEQRVYSLAFSPNGKTLVTGGDDKLNLWDVSARRELAALGGPSESHFLPVAFSPDGKTVAAGNADDGLTLWDVGTRQQLTTFKEPAGYVNHVTSAAFAPDGKTVAMGSEDGTATLWDLNGHKQLATLQGYLGHLSAVAFSPDGKILATVCEDGVTFWDVTSRQELAKLKGHAGAVLSAAFSPDGRILATGSSDRTVKLWDVSTRQELATLRGHTDNVLTLAFSPDGKILATGGEDKTLRLWTAATEGMVAQQK